MLDKEELEVIIKVDKIAKRLHALFRENSLHRLRLYQEHSCDPDDLKWTPDIHRQNLLIESLCKSLDTLIRMEEGVGSSQELLKDNNNIQIEELTH